MSRNDHRIQETRLTTNPLASGRDSTVPPPSGHEHPNQFALLRQRRFAPFFWTQFLGCRQRQPVQVCLHRDGDVPTAGELAPPAMAGLVIGALFILPFLLFSATSGQLTDKYNKTAMIRFVKTMEIGIMAIAAFGLPPTTCRGCCCAPF